ncbi:MAG: hypothetical protein SGCHY_002872 [Lobulomycetales sp.]
MSQFYNFEGHHQELPYSMTPPLPSPSPFQPKEQEQFSECLSAFSLQNFLPASFHIPDSPETLELAPPHLHSPSPRPFNAAGALTAFIDRSDSLSSNESFEMPMPASTPAPEDRQRLSLSGRSLLCPEPGCNATFAVSKHLRRHRMKHKPHRYRCSIPNCTQTSYRSDIMKQHEKSHRRAIEKSGSYLHFS